MKLKTIYSNLLTGRRLFELPKGPIKLRCPDGLHIDDDDGIKFCSQSDIPVVFHFAGGIDTWGGAESSPAGRRTWPVVHTFPEIEEGLRRQILSINTHEEATVLKSNQSFISALLNNVLADIKKYVADDM